MHELSLNDEDAATLLMSLDTAAAEFERMAASLKRKDQPLMALVYQRQAGATRRLRDVLAGEGPKP